MTAEALRIDGDDWSLDLLPVLETSFAIDFDDDELRSTCTVGQLHDLIAREAVYEGGAACGTMLVFHALRQALGPHGVPRRAGPDFLLGSLIRRPPRRVRAEVERATGLVLARPALGLGGCLGLALGALGSGGALVTGHGWYALPALGIGAAMIRLDRGSWTREWRTLGSLARATALRNHAILAERGARHSVADTWRTLSGLLGEWADVPPATIGRETRLAG